MYLLMSLKFDWTNIKNLFPKGFTKNEQPKKAHRKLQTNLIIDQIKYHKIAAHKMSDPGKTDVPSPLLFAVVYRFWYIQRYICESHCQKISS